MIRLVTTGNAERHISNLYQMHRLRKAVFKDRLGWDVSVSGELEFDEFDALEPSYLLSMDRHGTVNGCVRLLPTTGPNMLRDIFPSFVTKGAVPRSERVWEASRFAVGKNASTAETEAGVSQTTYDLLIGVLEFGLSNGINTIACVVDVRMERILRRVGWQLERLGSAHRIGNTIAMAGQLDVSAQILRALESRAGRTQAAAA
ncbi:MAG: acyl homoserine lactone synthase [Paraburkholderia sp.]|jgi:acyl homoserine lactone synthase|uniref:acyl-homoserine-lactone synthase n=1 Tax=Paraburkholderia sp. TaxID=1926495 RepID=UPI002AFFE2D4|nr:acyl-homoserine-lactone synthase [Paraburkholderia sp.]MEA3082776.1 acyl homoserine lactone synthase [Paraburkholderia sp.]